MPARANFECPTCKATIEDLPVDSVVCPRCGKRRGFRRLFDTVQVSTRGHRVARFIDKRMTPAFDQHTSRQQSAKRFESAVVEAKDRIYEQATPEQREQIAAAQVNQGPNGMKAISNIPASAALAAIDPVARHDSAVYTYPAVKRRVQPLWQQ
jgi:DNA-directed RNA polymerase subunit RPC12/RpoP